MKKTIILILIVILIISIIGVLAFSIFFSDKAPEDDKPGVDILPEEDEKEDEIEEPEDDIDPGDQGSETDSDEGSGDESDSDAETGSGGGGSSGEGGSGGGSGDSGDDADDQEPEEIDVSKLKFTKIKDLKEGMVDVNVEAEVDFLGETYGKGFGEAPYAIGFIKDETGEIKTSFWGDDLKKAKPGAKVRIIKGTVTTYKEQLQINSDRKIGMQFP